VELLAPETSQAEVSGFVERVLSIGRGVGIPLQVGAALFPGCATSPEALLEVARAALVQARRDRKALVWAPALERRSLAARAPSGEDRLVLLSPEMQQVVQLVDRVAARDVPVLIQGETGAGKEVVARAVHARSKRSRQKLVVVNCGALPAQLIESTLFGHVRGAFTGAHQQREGVFETAHGGSLLLDEIGELTPGAQAALLRVLETGRLTRVGSSEEVQTDVRIIAATHCDLASMASEGTFRQDLLYRLNVITLEVPPLRDRQVEIRALAERFIEQARVEDGCQVRLLEPSALAMLESYDWPGNVRELRNVVQRGVLLARGETLTVDDLPARIRQAAPSAAGDPEPRPLDLRELVEAYEASLVAQTLAHCDGDRSAAARLLGVPLRTLARKIVKYDL
jgi:DNA-binding NtrC family response regulator